MSVLVRKVGQGCSSLRGRAMPLDPGRRPCTAPRCALCALQVGADSSLESFAEALAPHREEGGHLAKVSDTSL